MTRLGIGGLMHESNTFASGLTRLEGFESGGLEVGERIRERWGEAHHEVGGAFQAAAELGAEAVPTLMGWATPSGPIEHETFLLLRRRLLDAIAAAGPLDAMVVCLHGAMVADGVADADGELIASVREWLGPRIPIALSLDFHGNVSERMAASANAVVAYRTYPHVDQRIRGRKAAELAIRAARGEIRPVTSLRKPPLIVHLLKQETGKEPFSKLAALAEAIERRPGILDASVMAGFPYADVAATGVSCLAVADGSVERADAAAEELADALWALRRELTAQPPPPAEAVRLAIAAEKTPALLIDIGDNIGGGSAADSTVLLHELHRQGATGFVVVLHDPDAASACFRAGVGASVTLEVGGKTDDNAPPFRAEGTVETLHDGKYVEDLPRHGGIRHNDQGPTAVIRIAGDNRIVVDTLRHPPFSLGQLTSLGIDPTTARIIVVKAAVAYKAAYAPIAGTIIEVDSPGLTASNPARYTYRNIRRPIHPLDQDAVWESKR